MVCWGASQIAEGGMCPEGIFFFFALKPAGLNNSNYVVGPQRNGNEKENENEYRKEEKEKVTRRALCHLSVSFALRSTPVCSSSIRITNGERRSRKGGKEIWIWWEGGRRLSC